MAADPSTSPSVQSLQYGYEGDRQYTGFYAHSGKVTLHGTLFALAVGLPAAVIAAIVYAYADLYMPIVYGNMALTAGFGMSIGWLAAHVMRWGKVRNVPVSLAIVGVLTLVAYYICWVAWEIAVLDRYRTPHPGLSFSTLLLNPASLYRVAVVIQNVGTWSIGSTHSSSSTGNDSISGFALVGFWAVEAVAIFASWLWIALKLASDRPFCERCDAWCDEGKSIKPLSAANASAIATALSARDWPLLAAATHGINATHWIEVVHHGCASCSQLHTVTATETRIKFDKRGRKTVTKKVLLNKLLMTPEEVQYLRALQPPPAAGTGFQTALTPAPST